MSDAEQAGIAVPLEQISEDALVGLIQEFVLREGTDYGAAEVSLEVKTRQILGQLHRGDVLVVFDPTDESCSLRRKEDVKCRPSISSPK